MSLAQSLLVFFVMPLINVIIWLIIADVILSLLIAFGVVQRGGALDQISYGLSRFTAPILDPIRRIMPNTGGIDLSPAIAILGLSWLNGFVIGQKILPMLG